MAIMGRGQRVGTDGSGKAWGRRPAFRARRWGVMGLACVLLLGTSAAPAQPAGVEAAEVSEGAGVELLLEPMLTEDRVLGDSLSGVAWDVEATPGRRLMQLPLRVVPGAAEWVIGEPSISFGGSRFVGWWLPIGEDALNTRSRSRGGSVAEAPTDEALLDLAGLLDHLETAEAEPRGGRRDTGVDDRAVAAGAGLPEGAPRLAREIVVKPDGRVAWEVARLIPGATVKAGETPYLLYLDGTRLRELKPEKENVTRNSGESSREFSQRRREIDLAYREELTEYRELQQSARGVPTLLEAELPAVVWAVFEVNAIQDEWTLRGGPAGTWSMGFDAFETLRALAGGQGISSWPGDGGAFSTEDRRVISTLDRLVKDRHPWTQRTLARALADSGYAANLDGADAVSDVFRQLLASTDEIARNRTVLALATTDPATPATASLLEDAAKHTGDPAVQLAALRARLAVQLAAATPQRGGRDATADLSGVIATVNASLADPGGADAGLVIKQLLTTVPAETPEAVNALVGGVRFEGLPADRFDAAVAAVLSSAGTQPAVVGGWVDRQLLGSSDRATVKRTLELMASADAPAPAVSAFAAALRGAVFGPPAPPEGSAEHSEGAEAAPPPRVTMTAGLPLDSSNHAIFRLLNAGDPEARKAGWSVLRHFELTDRAPSRGRRSAPAEGDGEDPLTLIVEAGLSQPQTPSSLVPFLLRQPDEARAHGPLLQVVLSGDTVSSRRAARGLLGSERDLGPAVAELEPAPRATLGNTVYDRVGVGPEPVTGLLAADHHRRGGTAAWFGERWAAGALPAAGEWAEQAGGESRLLPLVGGDDEAVAHGAIAALAAAAGADRALQLQLIDRFNDQRQTLSSDELQEAWGDAKKDIYTRRLTDAAGEYRLVMTVAGDEDAGRVRDEFLGYDPEAAAAQNRAAAGEAVRTERTVLGVVTLDADGRSVGIRGGTPTLSVPEDRLALRVDEPGQLLAYADEFESLQGLPLDGIDEPLDLLPEDDGGWRGQVPMPDGRVFGLEMEPWSGTASEEEN